jgi:homoserine O-acetyltransferase
MPAQPPSVRPEVRVVATTADPLPLRSGVALAPVALELETWGRPNADRSNAVLVCHSFSTDAHAAGIDETASAQHRPWRIGRPGWWDALIGPGKALDTDRWWVVCSGVLGGSAGSTGPLAIEPATGRPWGSRFPVIHVSDMVAAQRRLMDALGIPRWRLVVGGSLGGAQALAWSLDGGERVARVFAIAASAGLAPGGRRHFQRWSQHVSGDLAGGNSGLTGLHHAISGAALFSGGQVSQLSSDARNLAQTWPATRLHPVAYLTQARALLDFDLARDWGGGSFEAAARRIRAEVLLAGFHGDGVFSATSQGRLSVCLNRAGVRARAIVLPSQDGHDTFLTQPQIIAPALHAAVESDDWLGLPRPALRGRPNRRI